jgi:4'-phosphopantetheinyl transferase
MHDRPTFEGLAEDSIHIWSVPLVRSRQGENLATVLSQEELLRAGRFVHERDRERYLACHEALRRILAQYCGTPPEQLWFQVNEHGKPHLGEYPRLQFNLSHSVDLALIAVRAGGKVGVDIEEVRSDAATSGVAERFFSEGELRRLQSLTGDERTRAFFRCWTRKEAYLKAVGCGISDEDLKRVEVTLRPDESPAVLRGRAEGDGAREWSVFHLEPEDRFIGALVAEGANLQCTAKTWPADAP